MSSGSTQSRYTPTGPEWLKQYNIPSESVVRMQNHCVTHSKSKEDALTLMEALGLIPYRKDDDGGVESGTTSPREQGSTSIGSSEASTPHESGRTTLDRRLGSGSYGYLPGTGVQSRARRSTHVLQG